MGAVLEGANLEGVDLSGADITNASVLHPRAGPSEELQQLVREKGLSLRRDVASNLWLEHKAKSLKVPLCPTARSTKSGSRTEIRVRRRGRTANSNHAPRPETISGLVVIELVRPFDTERCEIIATLYSAWSDFLDQGMFPSDYQIVDEVLDN